MRWKLRLLGLALLNAIALAVGGPVGAQPLPAYDRPPRPHYPKALIDQGIEGNVGVGVLIGRDGEPKCVWIMYSSGHPELDALAAAALRGAKWVRQADELEALIPINFRIRNGTAPSPADNLPKIRPRVRKPEEAPWAPCSKATS